MPKKETVAFLCFWAGTLLGSFAKLYVIAALFYLVVLAIDIPILVEEYRKYKNKKELKKSGEVR